MEAKVDSFLGKITIVPTSTSQEFQCTWLIDGFSKCYRASGIADYYESPEFYIVPNEDEDEDEEGWTLDLFAAGYDYETADYVGIRLYCDMVLNDRKYTVEISLLNKEGKKKVTKSMILTQDNTDGPDGLFRSFILRRDLWNNKELLNDDKLNFACTVRIIEPSTSSVQLHLGPENSQLMLEKFWEDRQQFGDFKLILGKTEFHVHRGILAIASPVFRAMFESKMREANEGEVEIMGVESDVMEKLLRFIYVGKLDEKDYNRNQVEKLLVVAERYQLDSLKQMCEKFLIKQLHFENVMEILTLADQNNAQDLQQQAIEYFLMYRNAISTTANFNNSLSSLPMNLQTAIIRTFMARP